MAIETFDTWLRDSLLLSVKDGTATIGVRNQYAKEWLEHRLDKVIKETLGVVLGREIEVEFTVLVDSYRPG